MSTGFLIASYNSARSEIIERMKFRETTINLYITANMAYLGAMISFSASSRFDAGAPYLALIMPFIAIIFAFKITDQTQKIDLVAEFIRTEVAPNMDDTPFWDTYTSVGDVQLKKSRSLKWSNGLALHGPTVLSVFFSFYIQASKGLGSANFLWGLAAVAALALAVFLTIQSTRYRK